MAQPELKLHSLHSSEPIVYTWPLRKTKEYDAAGEIIETIKLVCKDFHELDHVTKNFVLNEVDKTDFESMKKMCDRFNKAVDTHKKLWKGATKPASAKEKAKKDTDILRHILQQVYNRSVADPEKLNAYKCFTPEVYGETSYDLVRQMIEKIQPTDKDVFLDLGSGVGQVVLQMAAATPCAESIGIEKADIPAKYAEAMDVEFKKLLKWYGRKHEPYKLIKGDFLDDKHLEMIRRATIIFVNNFAFGSHVNHQLKLRFADLIDKTRIISSKEFCPLNFRINDRNQSDIGCIMEVTELAKMPGAVSWTETPVTYYLHVLDRTKMEHYYFENNHPNKEDSTRRSRSLHGSKSSSSTASSSECNSRDSSLSKHQIGALALSCVVKSEEEGGSAVASSAVHGPTTRRAWSEWVKQNEKVKQKKDGGGSTSRNLSSTRSNATSEVTLSPASSVAGSDHHSSSSRSKPSAEQQPHAPAASAPTMSSSAPGSPKRKPGRPKLKPRVDRDAFGTEAKQKHQKHKQKVLGSSSKSALMETLNILHQQTLKTTNEVASVDDPSVSEIPCSLLTTATVASHVEESLSNIAVLTDSEYHRDSPEIMASTNVDQIIYARQQPASSSLSSLSAGAGFPDQRFEQDLEHYLSSLRQLMISIHQQFSQPEYRGYLLERVQAETARQKQLLQRVEQLERQIKCLQEDGVAVLKQRLAELGMDATTPADLLNKAKEIVMQHKELQTKASNLETEVNVLETQNKNLKDIVSERDDAAFKSGLVQQMGFLDVKNISEAKEAILREVHSLFEQRRKIFNDATRLSKEIDTLHQTGGADSFQHSTAEAIASSFMSSNMAMLSNAASHLGMPSSHSSGVSALPHGHSAFTSLTSGNASGISSSRPLTTSYAILPTGSGNVASGMPSKATVQPTVSSLSSSSAATTVAADSSSAAVASVAGTPGRPARKSSGKPPRVQRRSKGSQKSESESGDGKKDETEARIQEIVQKALSVDAAAKTAAEKNKRDKARRSQKSAKDAAAKQAAALSGGNLPLGSASGAQPPGSYASSASESITSIVAAIASDVSSQESYTSVKPSGGRVAAASTTSASLSALSAPSAAAAAIATFTAPGLVPIVPPTPTYDDNTSGSETDSAPSEHEEEDADFERPKENNQHGGVLQEIQENKVLTPVPNGGAIGGETFSTYKLSALPEFEKLNLQMWPQRPFVQKQVLKSQDAGHNRPSSVPVMTTTPFNIDAIMSNNCPRVSSAAPFYSTTSNALDVSAIFNPQQPLSTSLIPGFEDWSANRDAMQFLSEHFVPCTQAVSSIAAIDAFSTGLTADSAQLSAFSTKVDSESEQQTAASLAQSDEQKMEVTSDDENTTTTATTTTAPADEVCFEPRKEQIDNVNPTGSSSSNDGFAGNPHSQSNPGNPSTPISSSDDSKTAQERSKHNPKAPLGSGSSASFLRSVVSKRQSASGGAACVQSSNEKPSSTTASSSGPFLTQTVADLFGDLSSGSVKLQNFRIPRASKQTGSGSDGETTKTVSSTVQSPLAAASVMVKQEPNWMTQYNAKEIKRKPPQQAQQPQEHGPPPAKRYAPADYGIKPLSTYTPASQKPPLTRDWLEQVSSKAQPHTFSERGLMETILEHKMRQGRVHSHTQMSAEQPATSVAAPDDHQTASDEDEANITKPSPAVVWHANQQQSQRGPRTPPGTPPPKGPKTPPPLQSVGHQKKGPRTPSESPSPGDGNRADSSNVSRSPSMRGRSAQGSPAVGSSLKSSHFGSAEQRNRTPSMKPSSSSGLTLSTMAKMAKVNEEELQQMLDPEVLESMQDMDPSIVMITFSTVLRTLYASQKSKEAASASAARQKSREDVDGNAVVGRRPAAGKRSSAACAPSTSEEHMVTSSTSMLEDRTTVEMEIENDSGSNDSAEQQQHRRQVRKSQNTLDYEQMPAVEDESTAAYNAKVKEAFEADYENFAASIGYDDHKVSFPDGQNLADSSTADAGYGFEPGGVYGESKPNFQPMSEGNVYQCKSEQQEGYENDYSQPPPNIKKENAEVMLRPNLASATLDQVPQQAYSLAAVDYEHSLPANVGAPNSYHQNIAQQQLQAFVDQPAQENSSSLCAIDAAAASFNAFAPPPPVLPLQPPPPPPALFGLQQQQSAALLPDLHKPPPPFFDPSCPPPMTLPPPAILLSSAKMDAGYPRVEAGGSSRQQKSLLGEPPQAASLQPPQFAGGQSNLQQQDQQSFAQLALPSVVARIQSLLSGNSSIPLPTEVTASFQQLLGNPDLLASSLQTLMNSGINVENVFQQINQPNVPIQTSNFQVQPPSFSGGSGSINPLDVLGLFGGAANVQQETAGLFGQAVIQSARANAGVGATQQPSKPIVTDYCHGQQQQQQQQQQTPQQPPTAFLPQPRPTQLDGISAAQTAYAGFSDLQPPPMPPFPGPPPSGAAGVVGVRSGLMQRPRPPLRGQIASRPPSGGDRFAPQTPSVRISVGGGMRMPRFPPRAAAFPSQEMRPRFPAPVVRHMQQVQQQVRFQAPQQIQPRFRRGGKSGYALPNR